MAENTYNDLTVSFQADIYVNLQWFIAYSLVKPNRTLELNENSTKTEEESKGSVLYIPSFQVHKNVLCAGPTVDCSLE